MFAKAVGIASQFTRPVILSRLFYDKSVESGMGAFVVVNDEGWIITAAHVFQASAAYLWGADMSSVSEKVDAAS